MMIPMQVMQAMITVAAKTCTDEMLIHSGFNIARKPTTVSVFHCVLRVRSAILRSNVVAFEPENLEWIMKMTIRITIKCRDVRLLVLSDEWRRGVVLVICKSLPPIDARNVNNLCTEGI